MDVDFSRVRRFYKILYGNAASLIWVRPTHFRLTTNNTDEDTHEVIHKTIRTIWFFGLFLFLPNLMKKFELNRISVSTCLCVLSKFKTPDWPDLLCVFFASVFYTTWLYFRGHHDFLKMRFFLVTNVNYLVLCFFFSNFN